MITDRNREAHLLKALKQSAGLNALGCRIERCLSGGLSVAFSDAVVGFWWSDGGRFHFAFARSSRPEYSLASIEDVLSLTASLATRQRIRMEA